jgi:hypothetical protein
MGGTRTVRVFHNGSYVNRTYQYADNDARMYGEISWCWSDKFHYWVVAFLMVIIPGKKKVLGLKLLLNSFSFNE